MVCLSIFSLGFTSALTASIGNARAVIYPELKAFGTTDIDRTIKVINTNNVSVNVSIYVPTEFQNIAEVKDKSFILAPKEEKDAKYTIHLTEAGDYDIKFNVVFSEPGKDGGLVLTSTLVILATKDGVLGSGEENSPLMIMLISTAILLAILVIVGFLYLRRKKKKVGGMK